MTWSCAECFQKCFSAENIIILLLNTIIPIIFMVRLSKVTCTDGLFIASCLMLLLDISVLSIAYHMSTQNPFFSREQTGQSFKINA